MRQLFPGGRAAEPDVAGANPVDGSPLRSGQRERRTREADRPTESLGLPAGLVPNPDQPPLQRLEALADPSDPARASTTSSSQPEPGGSAGTRAQWRQARPERAQTPRSHHRGSMRARDARRTCAFGARANLANEAARSCGRATPALRRAGQTRITTGSRHPAAGSHASTFGRVPGLRCGQP